MTVAVSPGTPAPGNPASPAPSTAADPSSVPTAPDGVVGPSPDEGADGDGMGDARRKAREILFAEKEPEGGDEVVEGEAKSEVKPTEPKTEERPKDEIALSKEWARVSAQETRLKTKQKEFLAEKTAFSTEKESVLKAKQDLESQLNDPVAYLSKAGWSKDKIVEWIQSDGKVDPEILVKQLSEKHQKEIDELRAERKREREELEGAQQQRRMAEVEGQLNDEVVAMVGSDAELAALKRLIDKNPQKFKPFVQTRVGSIIREVWKKTFNKGENEGTGKGTVVDPRDALLYLQSELTELQLGDPGQAPAVRSANPVAVEPTPITNQATSARSVRAVEYDESDPEQRRERARKILEGEIDE